jgi:Mn2+/Fe2+ NRAMP family transporter
MDEDGAHVAVKPAWLAPVIILSVVVALVLVGKKEDKAVENPVVDLAIITIAVFAFAAVFRKIANMMDHPGLATFFGGPVQPHPDSDTVHTGEGY